MAKFAESRDQVRSLYEKMRAERIALRNGVDTDAPDDDFVDETVTIPLNTVMELVEKPEEIKVDAPTED